MVGKPGKPIKVNEASNHEIYLNSPNDRQLWDFIRDFFTLFSISSMLVVLAEVQ
jgi:hypothetical protein